MITFHQFLEMFQFKDEPHSPSTLPEKMLGFYDMPEIRSWLTNTLTQMDKNTITSFFIKICELLPKKGSFKHLISQIITILQKYQSNRSSAMADADALIDRVYRILDSGVDSQSERDQLEIIASILELIIQDFNELEYNDYVHNLANIITDNPKLIKALYNYTMQLMSHRNAISSREGQRYIPTELYSVFSEFCQKTNITVNDIFMVIAHLQDEPHGIEILNKATNGKFRLNILHPEAKYQIEGNDAMEIATAIYKNSKDKTFFQNWICHEVSQ